MRRLFGTDGIRGVAGKSPLDRITVTAIGVALAHHLKSENPRIILGMDTRESGSSIAAAISGGLRQSGTRVESAGVITTPAIAYLTTAHGFDAGIVISASHNPWQDNGIKVFGPDGYKLPDATELAIENEIFRLLGDMNSEMLDDPISTPVETSSYRNEYVQALLKHVEGLSLDDKRIVIDCANGAASFVAPQLFEGLQGEVRIHNASPDGRNINENCGALHPEGVAKMVVEEKGDLGITFDGDADRALFADEHGNVINGDAIMLLAARDLKEQGKLNGDIVVATTMSNMGLEAALKNSGIRMLRANVGDKYVLEMMQKNSASLGGEQSGHILFGGRSTTGDGLLTALLVLDIMHRTGKSLAELTQDLKVYPQVIVNVKVRVKTPLNTIPSVAGKIAEAEKELADTGRVVIRYSGTEALARVMIEAEDEEQMQRHADAIADAIRAELGV
ncbi:MAG: phosphoglucosamine mutase [Acidobacteria bacterium]|nr:phosphoglucosamine mutase [Acidobacteriota bacterium]